MVYLDPIDEYIILAKKSNLVNSSFFINIGLPKTGTTWLYDLLNEHPEVQLPFDKEIRYFWAKEHLKANKLSNYLSGDHWHFKEKRYLFFHNFLASFSSSGIDIPRLRWYIRYFFAKKDDDWYLSLFPKDMTTGDITPKYCELSRSMINRVHQLLPDAKLILILRDPIEREWSRAKMNLLKKRNRSSIQEVDEKVVFRHFEDQEQLRSNDYTALINRWLSYFQRDQLLILYFDEIQQRPLSVYQKVCDFLGLSFLELPHVHKKSNEGLQQQIPKLYLKRLVALNYPFIEKFHQHYPNEFNKQWLARYQSVYRSLKD